MRETHCNFSSQAWCLETHRSWITKSVDDTTNRRVKVLLHVLMTSVAPGKSFINWMGHLIWYSCGKIWKQNSKSPRAMRLVPLNSFVSAAQEAKTNKFCWQGLNGLEIWHLNKSVLFSLSSDAASENWINKSFYCGVLKRMLHLIVKHIDLVLTPKQVEISDKGIN